MQEQTARSGGDATIPILSSRDLMRGGREILIEHDGQHYRLRRTRQGKLILTK